MQAIQTRYFGPGNVRGSRIKAWCAAKTIYVNRNAVTAIDADLATLVVR
jgi:hypothetical protein